MFTIVNCTFIWLDGIIISFPFESALVEFARPMKVDQLCVMVKLVKESMSTSVMLETAHNHS